MAFKQNANMNGNKSNPFAVLPEFQDKVGKKY